MKKLLILLTAGLIISCNNASDSTTETDTTATDNTEAMPRDPNEAITDTTMIVNDSVIVPDTGNRNPDPSKQNNSQ